MGITRENRFPELLINVEHRKSIENLNICLCHRDIVGTVGQIIYANIPLMSLHMNPSRKPGKKFAGFSQSRLVLKTF